MSKSKALSAVFAIALSACADTPPPPWAQGYGAQPELPAPQSSWMPTVNIAPALGWPEGTVPRGAPGTRVGAFARGLEHPRWLHVLPNGDVLVAETNTPHQQTAKGFKAWITGLVMKRAGAGAASANRITLLRDTDGDGVADVRSVFLDGLNSPFGMALVGPHLYVADTDAVRRFVYAEGDTRLASPGVRVVELPAGDINHHWTKNLMASPDGTKLWVTVGSNSNVAERGMEAEAGRAAIWEVDIATGNPRVFASGLRNPNGLAWEPVLGALWTVVNERDDLGNDLVPDFMTSVQDGGFYGWPYSYFGPHVDERVLPPKPDLVARALVP
ncbi:MAG TPA: PQQ-dependent sugar dehydrogenase, partial [Burkholderiaceae bacterium]|nr:PQQ-dependent sugar dehydrogenase [Burkholderiaceae bacterium]